jgi:hypothetical protein
MAAMPEIDRLKAVLVIGVTGHRDIRDKDREQLKNSVRNVFMGLREQYRHTPFILLSPLAEGADRLVAEVALLPEIDARLIAPLPMRKDMYEADFESPNSLAEFNRLLGRADHSFEIPLVADEAAVSQPGTERNLQYEAVGKYIARESQILIALWDGAETGKVGGTAAIVKFQTEGLPERRACRLSPPELFPVYHILTPRVSNPHPEGKLAPYELKVIYPPAFGFDAEAKKYYKTTFGNLNEFDRLIAKRGPALKKKTAESKAWVIGDFDEQRFSRSEGWTLNRFVVADTLAIRYQKWMLWTHRALHWVVFLSFSSFVFFAHLHCHPWPVLLVSLILLGTGVSTHMCAKWAALDAKRQDYRAMAEGCRVRFFWQLAGVKASVPDNYLGRQRTELDWIRYGLVGWEVGLDHHPSAAWIDPRERLQFILKHWVEDQYEYFRRAIKKSEENSELMEGLVRACLVIAIQAAVELLIATWWRTPLPPGEEPIWMVGGIIAIDLLLAGAALLHHANERMAHSEHLKQYRRMLNVFDNAIESIQGLLKSGKFAAATTCLRALGKEALIENGDWVLLHRERPLEIPHP